MYEQLDQTKYHVFNSESREDIAKDTNNTYANDDVVVTYLVTGDTSDEEASITLDLGDTIKKVNEDLVFVTEPSPSNAQYYEAWSRDGLRNAAVLPSVESNTINEMPAATEYTYTTQYVLKSGTAYYSYAALEIDTTGTEPQVRYDFASGATGYADASNNDVLYIVTDISNITSGNQYMMIDNVRDLILATEGNNYLSDVDNVYFSSASGTSPLTLAEFAADISNDLHHFKEISSTNLNGATQYTWKAKDLVHEYVDLSKYIAFTAGALAYTAVQLNSESKSIDYNGNMYYVSQTGSKVLTNS
jgi:hypothetical protein